MILFPLKKKCPDRHVVDRSGLSILGGDWLTCCHIHYNHHLVLKGLLVHLAGSGRNCYVSAKFICSIHLSFLHSSLLSHRHSVVLCNLFSPVTVVESDNSLSLRKGLRDLVHLSVWLLPDISAFQRRMVRVLCLIQSKISIVIFPLFLTYLNGFLQSQSYV